MKNLDISFDLNRLTSFILRNFFDAICVFVLIGNTRCRANIHVHVIKRARGEVIVCDDDTITTDIRHPMITQNDYVYAPARERTLMKKD